MIPIDDLKEHFLDYLILDCVVENRSVFYFVAQQDQEALVEKKIIDEVPDDDYLPKRVIRLDVSKPDAPKVMHLPLINFAFVICAGISFEPDAKPIVIDGRSAAWVNNPGTTGLEDEMESLAHGGLLGGAITRVRSLGGKAICISNNHDVLIRKGVNSWERLGPEIPRDSSNSGANTGFEDFDGFSPDNIYAAGGRGDVWRFDGKTWRRVDFPTNSEITSICCAGDDWVYVGLDEGTVYRGKEDTWEKIHDGNLKLAFKDMVWFENKVWCTSDFGVWTITNGKLANADVAPDVKLSAGNASTRDGVLLVAGLGGAAFKADGKWNTIFQQHILKSNDQ